MKQERSRKPKPSPGAAPLHGSAAQPIGALSPGRKWLFRLLAVLVVPLLVLGGLELLLRIFGFGFDPHFFKRTSISGYAANHDFGLRFFPRSQVRVPYTEVMPAAKAPKTFRIFIFGESAALGDPRPNYGAGRYLEVLLGERFPETKFEIVNTSVTAINSHVILPIAQECTHYDGDLWVIYMGNNEMVGPFGAATVFGARAPPLWLVRAELRLRSLRLGQVLLAATQKLRKSDTSAAAWRGMEMFVRNPVAPDDVHKQTIYRNFERNLQEIVKAGKGCGASIILSTVAVNLKDCPPFGSVSGTNLPPANREEYGNLCDEGTAAEAKGDFVKAHSCFQRAAEILPDSAQAQFELATCLARLTNATAARSHFQKAVDDDTLPFRADSRINEIIRGTVRSAAGASLSLCDAAEALGSTGSDGIPGEEQFYEHVHLNPTGNYALALAWANEAAKLLRPDLKRGARPSWASQTECEQCLGLTDWNRVSILDEILRRIQRPPYSSQSGHAQQIAGLRDEIAQLRQRLTNDAATEARQVYLKALSRAPDNFRLHQNFAEFLEARQEWKPAIAERKKVCELLPDFYFPYYALGLDLKDDGAPAEAREALLKAAALEPDQGEVRMELGIVCGRQGDWEQARRELETARRLSPEEPRVPLYLGEVLWKLEHRTEAVSVLREAIHLAPSEWQPHYRLATDLAQEGQFSEALGEYQEALRLNPANVKIKVGLAKVLLNLGREPEAVRQLDEALKLEPRDPAALELRAKLRSL